MWSLQETLAMNSRQSLKILKKHRGIDEIGEISNVESTLKTTL